MPPILVTTVGPFLIAAALLAAVILLGGDIRVGALAAIGLYAALALIGSAVARQRIERADRDRERAEALARVLDPLAQATATLSGSASPVLRELAHSLGVIRGRIQHDPDRARSAMHFAAVQVPVIERIARQHADLLGSGSDFGRAEAARIEDSFPLMLQASRSIESALLRQDAQDTQAEVFALEHTLQRFLPP